MKLILSPNISYTKTSCWVLTVFEEVRTLLVVFKFQSIHSYFVGQSSYRNQLCKILFCVLSNGFSPKSISAITFSSCFASCGVNLCILTLGYNKDIPYLHDFYSGKTRYKFIRKETDLHFAFLMVQK